MRMAQSIARSIGRGKLVGNQAFSKKTKAQDFERYMKSASGRAFASKRLW
jgi:hypothetical protein